MKKIIFLLSLSFIFASCEKKASSKLLLKPDATVNIREAKQTRSADPETPTWEYVVKNSFEVTYLNKKLAGDKPQTMMFVDALRDIPNLTIKLWAACIINERSDKIPFLVEDFLTAEDVVFVDLNRETKKSDTIAYIPNATIREAESKIRAAYAANDFETVYALFDKAYTAIPITAKAWRELKAQGNQ